MPRPRTARDYQDGITAASRSGLAEVMTPALPWRRPCPPGPSVDRREVSCPRGRGPHVGGGVLGRRRSRAKCPGSAGRLHDGAGGLSPPWNGPQMICGPPRTRLAPLLIALLILQAAPALAEPEVYFSPNGEIRDRLLRAINHTKATMDLAIFDFTSGELAGALLAARERGVAIRIVADARQAQGKHSEVPFLLEKGLKVRLARGNAVALCITSSLSSTGGSWSPAPTTGPTRPSGSITRTRSFWTTRWSSGGIRSASNAYTMAQGRFREFLLHMVRPPLGPSSRRPVTSKVTAGCESSRAPLTPPVTLP